MSTDQQGSTAEHLYILTWHPVELGYCLKSISWELFCCVLEAIYHLILWDLMLGCCKHACKFMDSAYVVKDSVSKLGLVETAVFTCS